MTSRCLRRTIALLAMGVATAPLVACGSTGSTGAGPPSPRPTASVTSPATSRTPPAGPSTAPSSTPPPSSAPSTSAPTQTGLPVPPSLAGRVLTTLPTSRAVVALTFDAGANAAGLPSILATLGREHVPATFFLTGRFVQLFPESARSVATAGGLIGNHTYDHPDLTQLAGSSVRREILDGATAIRQVTGAATLPWFRFPYGAYDTATLATANELGYAAVGWTVDTLGWKGTSGGSTAALVQQRVLAGLRPGEIVLMHVGSNPEDGTTLDAAALPGVIASIRAHGYGFVTIAAALTG